MRTHSSWLMAVVFTGVLLVPALASAGEDTGAGDIFVWHQLVTRKPAKAKLFYKSVLGWTTKGEPVGDFKDYMVFMNGERQIGGLLTIEDTQAQSQEASEYWLTFISVDNASQIVAKAKELGGKVVMPVTKLPYGDFAVLQDSTEAVFGIFQAKDQAEGTRNQGDIFVWHEVMSRDAKKTISFYKQLFGWGGKVEKIEGADYVLLQKGDRVIGGLLPMKGPEFQGVPANWSIYVAVDNAETAIAKTEKNGGQVFKPLTTVPYGRFAVLGDSTGSAFAVFETKQP